METIISKNPLTGQVLSEIEQTPLDEIPKIISRAASAQIDWSKKTIHERVFILKKLQQVLVNNMDSLAKKISDETGKPSFEALAMEVIPCIGMINTYCKRAPKLLKDKPIKLEWTVHRKSYLNYWPKGVVAVIAPWNFPFTIPFGEVFMALLAGNAVVLKPSEVTTASGLLLHDLFKDLSLPENLFQIVIGDGTRGAALASSNVNKICFTGSVSTGKKVMSAASEKLTPVVLELGGKDPMIVFEDANLDYATSAALWGGYCNSGQACASTERILVHESVHDRFVSLLTEKVKKLSFSKFGMEGDLGAITFDNQKNTYLSQLSELSSNNSKILTGGTFNKEKTQLSPSVVINPQIENSTYPLEGTQLYTEETFGPMVAVTKFSSTDEAIEKANKSAYGLLASVITGDIAFGETVAKKIQAGSVLINEVLYTHALSETPWHGVKNSGIGVVHSDLGLLEFVNVRHIHKPRWFSKFIKAPWWFPYSEFQRSLFHSFTQFLYGKNIVIKVVNAPIFLAKLAVLYIKKRRL